MAVLEEKLAEAVRQFPVLYDKHCRDFKDNSKLVRQSQIVQSVLQDCQNVLSHLLPECNLLVQGPKITYNYCLSRRF